MGEVIYTVVQIIFIAVELFLMYMMHNTKDDPDMDVNINIYNLLLGYVCALYFIMRTFFG